MKQTAVDWLIEKLNQCEPMYSGIQSNEHKEHLDILIEQAKEMEMQQIMNAVNFGNTYNGWALKHEFKKYYDKNYKNEAK